MSARVNTIYEGEKDDWKRIKRSILNFTVLLFKCSRQTHLVMLHNWKCLETNTLLAQTCVVFLERGKAVQYFAVWKDLKHKAMQLR